MRVKMQRGRVVFSRRRWKAGCVAVRTGSTGTMWVGIEMCNPPRRVTLGVREGSVRR
jgi:hypothetical protein